MFNSSPRKNIFNVLSVLMLSAYAFTSISILPSLAEADPIDPSGLQKFVDPLPIATVAKPKGEVNGADYYEITEELCYQKLHRDLPETPLFGYNGMVPGPTIEAKEGKPVMIKFINNLPETHILPIDHSIMGAGEDVPDVRTVIHLHGANCPVESDGFPTDWFTVGQSQTYLYPNQQDARTLWYHDHSIGITRLNPYAGLAGFYLIRDLYEKILPLPSGKYEVAMVIQDKSLNADATLYYPPTWEPEFFGNAIAVNGKAWPYMDVEPRKYRLRILNGSNARFYHLKFSNGMPFMQIGTEGGFLPNTVALTDILIAPGERFDVIVDFSKFKGQNIILTNDAPTPYPDGDPVDANTSQVMLFKVKMKASSPDFTWIPFKLRNIPRIPEAEAVMKRDMVLSEVDMPNGLPMPLINEKHFLDPVTENPRQGTAEIWQFINTTGDSHPMHLHLVNFQILNRQRLDVDRYLSDKGNGTLGLLENYLIGGPVPPPDNEMGWKETAINPPGYVTRYIMRWDTYAGLSVYHCHILEHEEMDMMRPLRVITGDHPNTNELCSKGKDHFSDCDSTLFSMEQDENGGGMSGM